MHRFFSLLARVSLLLLGLFFSSLSLGQSTPSPEVTRGVTWLAAQVTSTGQLVNDTQSIATPFQTRVEAALALRLLNTLPSLLVTAVGAEQDDPTEYLARKAIILSMNGADTSQILASLLNRQNSDGGFGAANAFNSGAYDTAWAVLALTQLGQSPGPNAIQARAYLRTVQQIDGGIGEGSDAQRLIETAFAAFAFRTGTEAASLAAAQSAVNYLKLSQLADASWASSLYVTATVWTAISSDIERGLI